MTDTTMGPFVGNTWLTGTDIYEPIDPTSEKPIGTVSLAGTSEIDAAVDAARHALDEGPWGQSTPGDRAAMMHAFADALETRASGTAELVTHENGMPIGLSEAVNGFVPSFLLRTYADLARGLELEERRGATVIRREPVGVVAAIAPWNFPQALGMIKVAPALAAGCTVVLKPAPETSLDAAAIAEAARDAGLPPGVLNIVPADRDVGAYLVAHRGVDKVAFTGSTAAGRSIGETCGRLIRRITLELGGKSAAIVLDDADLDVFAAGLGNSAFQNSGQACISQSRILAPRSRYEQVIDAVAAYADNLVVGDPMDRSVTCGPMATRVHRDRVLGHMERAKSSARLVVGGGIPTAMDTGFFVEPTVFADVDNAAPLAREEVFGPVLAIIGYDDEADAVRLANDNPYGLAGSVWTSDPGRGMDVARRIRTGTIGVNHYNLDLGAPFGGMKDSGIGREGGPEGLDAYLEYKSIYLGE